MTPRSVKPFTAHSRADLEVSNPDLRAPLRVVDGLAPRCEGTEHYRGTYGHSPGPARFVLSGDCLDCGHTFATRVCVGRANDVRELGLYCDGCRRVYPPGDPYIKLDPIAKEANPSDVVILVDDSGRVAHSTRDGSFPEPPEGAEADWPDAVERFLAHLTRSGAAKPTRTLRSYHLRRFAADCGKGPWSVTLRDLTDHVDRHEWAPSTVKSFRSTVREFYTWAVLEERTTHNPADRLPRVRVPSGVPRPAADEALQNALNTSDERTGLMIRLAAYAGLRCREIALVHSEDVTNSSGAWTLLVHGKGERKRHVPLPADLGAHIRSAADGWLFPGQQSGHLSAQHVSKLISRAMPGATAHQLRHRYATRAYQLGGRDIRAVQELLGHASVSTTQVYTGVEGDALRRAAAAAALAEGSA